MPGPKETDYDNHVKMILSKALKNTAKETAEDLIHYLGSQGYRDFKKLLKINKQS